LRLEAPRVSARPTPKPSVNPKKKAPSTSYVDKFRENLRNAVRFMTQASAVGKAVDPAHEWAQKGHADGNVISGEDVKEKRDSDSGTKTTDDPAAPITEEGGEVNECSEDGQELYEDECVNACIENEKRNDDGKCENVCEEGQELDEEGYCVVKAEQEQGMQQFAPQFIRRGLRIIQGLW